MIDSIQDELIKIESITLLISKNKDFLKWKELLEKSKPSIPEEKINIDLEVYKYQHYTKFTATMIDIVIYFIYKRNIQKVLV